MASISRGQSKIGIGPASTWGTAVNCTYLTHGRITVGNSRTRKEITDVGFANFVTEVLAQEELVDVTFSFQLAYHDAQIMAMAHFFGTDTSSLTDTTAYTHILKFDEENDGEFNTLAWLYETDAAAEIPTVKWNSLTVTQAANGLAECVLTGIGDKVVIQNDTPQNTVSELNALSYQDAQYQHAILGGTNHYFRMNTNAGDALDSGDDLGILSYSFTITRPHVRDFELRGANTKYTVEPLQTSASIGTFTVNLSRIDDGVIDLINLWSDKTKMKAEIFQDGAAVSGSTTNASWKFAFPSLQPNGDIPPGYDLPDNADKMRPSLTFDMIKESAAPTGMTGNTTYAWLTAINDITTAHV